MIKSNLFHNIIDLCEVSFIKQPFILSHECNFQAINDSLSNCLMKWILKIFHPFYDTDVDNIWDFKLIFNMTSIMIRLCLVMFISFSNSQLVFSFIFSLLVYFSNRNKYFEVEFLILKSFATFDVKTTIIKLQTLDAWKYEWNYIIVDWV